MPSIYLESADYATYGLPSTTTAAQVLAASSLIDGFLQRTDGLIYIADSNGYPCYMVAKQAQYSLIATSGITAGNNVVLTVSGAYLQLKIGDVLIIDRANPSIVEAVSIVSILGNQITLTSVSFNHSAGAVLEFGLVVDETQNTPVDRNILNVFQTPIVRLIAGQGQYGYPRRGDNIDYSGAIYNMQLVMAYSGGPPLFENFSVVAPYTYIEIDNGVVYYPTGIYMLQYSKVRLQYIAGWTYATLPSQIKQACANLVLAQGMQSSLGLAGPIKSFKQGDTQIQRFGGSGANSFSNIDDDTRSLLIPYRLRTIL
jgi:hypothetical protein